MHKTIELFRNAILNVRIGKKLALVLGLIIALLALQVGLSTWSLQILIARMQQAQQQSSHMVLASRIASDLADLNTQMGYLTISADLKLDEAQVISLHRDQAAALAESKALPDSAKGKKLVTNLEAAVKHWEQTNQDIVRLAGLHDRAKATALYRTEIPDRYGDTKAAIGDLLEYRREQLDLIIAERDRLAKQAIQFLLGIGLLAILIAVVCGRSLTRSIARPLKAATHQLTGIANGDISRDVPPEFLHRGDEIGDLARSMQTMSENLRTMVHEIAAGIAVLSSSSGALLSASSRLNGGSRDASERSHRVSAAAEQMSSNIASVAAGMEETAANLHNIACSTEQMTSSIAEIAGNSEQARQISIEASIQATCITDRINALGAAARAIDQITETIANISSQTNLLALNATIEAARAGKAGKGFAVVATEIKALAQQTAAATKDIQIRINSVQTATSAGITEIGRVSQVIERVSAIVATIAAAIEEQTATTKNIAQHIADASAGVSNANTRVSETATVSREIANDIGVVDQAVREMAASGEHVRLSTEQLSDVAGQLKVTASRFHS